MKNLFLILLILPIFFFAQNKRFFYEYNFKPDSTENVVIKEIMYLDINDINSLFYSQRKFVSDSTIVEDSKKGKFGMPPKDLNIFYQIEKKDNKIYYKTNDFNLGKIKVEDTRKMNWSISSETKKIGDYRVQKASTNFAGRVWIAWFSTDIPFQEGPYKFHGLPGLIVKLEDNTKSHIFELIGNSNLLPFVYPEIENGKEKSTSLEEFRKHYKNYRKDPASGIRQQYMQGKIPNQRDSEGNMSTGLDVVNRVEKLLKERLKKDNNILELDLLK
ncbi:GLPGLI family protein [Chryseobacterium oryctis]|uniref:GLPGLI family protein n=1 Tax=Chryseobacterium oryctis TaxID=2952618 RepID=A0ABT3HSC7_9FLAO|nr:GLPGLI family protein [Chryseobacterium oryctis]MCW3162696.1 GLPGLI family protein [Chryseobacterium oryctis]